MDVMLQWIVRQTRRNMTGLMVFTILALAGCTFLIYFMVALWRDSRRFRQGPRAEIRTLEGRKKRKLFRLDSLGNRHGRQTFESKSLE